MITSKLRPGRINGFEQYVYQKQATKEYNLSICDYIPQAKECLKTYGIFGAEEYWKLQTMNIPINDKLLGYCSCCILGEAGALKELIKYSSSLYQTDSELRKKVKRLLRKLALAKYPLEGADRYSDEYYMILADYHLGVFGKQKYMSYDRAMAFLSVVQDRESNYSEIAKAKLCCCRVLSSSAEFPPSENDLKKLDENAPRYEFCALTALVFSLSPELPDKTQRKTYQKKALTYLSMLINCNLKCFIDLLNYIGERELLGDVNRKQKKTIRKFSGDSLSDTNWYGLKD